jgi:hypothetical protein
VGRAYECSACEHVQVVGVIDNGRSGFADPSARCGLCGAVGKFAFAPGAKRQAESQGRRIVALLRRVQPEGNA